MADLTDTASVREHLQITDATDTTQNALIATLITAASTAIHSYCQREFATDAGTGSVARKFRYNGNGVLPLAPWDARSITSVVIDTDGTNPDNITLTADEYRALPLGATHGVYHTLHIRGRGVSSGSSTPWPTYRQVTVTGTWGFASVPAPVELACILTVAYWLRETSQHVGQVFGEETSFDAARASIPAIAKRLLDPYRVRGVS